MNWIVRSKFGTHCPKSQRGLPDLIAHLPIWVNFSMLVCSILISIGINAWRHLLYVNGSGRPAGRPYLIDRDDWVRSEKWTDLNVEALVKL